MPILTQIDVIGVQQYVFASNRLRDCVAASWLVHWATVPDGALHGSGGEVLLAGGGAATLRFAEIAHARRFAARYTRCLYDNSPGLDAVVVHREYSEGSLATALTDLHKDIAREKLERVPSAQLLGISVTASCNTTGLPANGFDSKDHDLPLSSMVLRWRDASDLANERWRDYLKNTTQYSFPMDLDNLGRSHGEASFLGVVHIDGNGIGKLIAAWTETNQAVGDGELCRQIKEWSAALDEAGSRALSAVVNLTTASIAEGEVKGRIGSLDFKLSAAGAEQLFLPVRPILLGGDDLTFICDGRLALSLTEAALRAFETDITHLGKITACAGIAITGTHSPFSRAYDMAAALCENAKRAREQARATDSWLDWHIGSPRPGGDIDALRRRSYGVGKNGAKLQLTCRPYRLGGSGQDEGTWRWLDETVLGTDGQALGGNYWRQHHNKVKDLAALVREGPDAIGRARQTWTTAGRLKLPGSLNDSNGFLDAKRTPLLDAIELLDLHQPLMRHEA